MSSTTKDDIVGLVVVSYAAITAVAYGFAAKSMIASGIDGVASIIFSIPVAAFWPASGLIWFGVWLA